MNKHRRTLFRGAAAGSGASLFGLPLGLPLSAMAAAASNGTVVIGTTLNPGNLNPVVRSGLATMLPAAQLFASPFRMDQNWQPRPYLAEQWSLSDDHLSLRMTLNKQAVFHDGEPVTTADLLFSLQMVQRHHSFKSLLAPVKSVTIEDRQRAVIQLKRPHPALPLAMSTVFVPILPRHIFGGSQDLLTHPRNIAPIGCGPFRLVDFVPGEQIVLERFKQFFEPSSPRLRRILFRRYESPAQLLAALDKGEVDLHLQLNHSIEVARAEQKKSVTVLKNVAPALGPLVWVAFNTRHPKLLDRRVRQAISYALDKDFMNKTLLGNAHKRSTGPITSASPYYSANVNTYPFDLEKATALLQEAGLTANSDGIRLSLRADALPGNPDVKLLQEYLVPSLAKIGIQVSLRTSDKFKTWARRISNHDFEMTIDSVWNWGDPVIGVHRSWDSQNIRKGVIWSNTQQYANPKVDALLAAAAVSTDETERKKLYATFQSIVTEDCPVAFVSELQFNYGINQRVIDPPNGVWGLAAPATTMDVKTGA